MKGYLDKNYYSQLIDKQLDLKFKTLAKLKEDQIKESNLASVKMNLFKKDFHILIAMFSRGDHEDKLKEFYLSIIDHLDEVWIEEKVKMKDEKTNESINIYYVDYYIYMRWLLSLAILLEIENSEFQILVNLIDRDNINDVIYDFLIASKFENRTVSKSLALEKPTNKIKDLILMSEELDLENSLKIYLEKDWYKTYKYFGFFNSHKKAPNVLHFFGYWAFEVAAIVKIKELDDSSFRDNKYYPDRLL